jgi:hypothetical protein
MLRRYFHKAEPPTEGGRAHDNDKKEGNKAEEFPKVHDCFMIYGGQVANASARHRKQERREVCSVKVAAPVYLDWSDNPITFDQGDHPDRVPEPRKVPACCRPRHRQRQAHQGPHGRRQQPQHHLRRDPWALVDRSVHDTDRCGALSWDHPREARPAPWTTRSVRCFGTPSKFRKETLMFEVVEFRGTYHAVLGRPCYAKFMVVPNYTYPKLKMQGP